MNQIVHSQMDWTKGEGPVRNGRQRLRVGCVETLSVAVEFLIFLKFRPDT